MSALQKAALLLEEEAKRADALMKQQLANKSFNAMMLAVEYGALLKVARALRSAGNKP